jgi:hypothetical protein
LKLEENKEEEDKIEYSISKDFEFNFENNYYFKSCNRCGGEFIIKRKDFEELIINNSNLDRATKIIINNQETKWNEIDSKLDEVIILYKIFFICKCYI